MHTLEQIQKIEGELTGRTVYPGSDTQRIADLCQTVRELYAEVKRLREQLQPTKYHDVDEFYESEE